jgi:hypothetical protein
MIALRSNVPLSGMHAEVKDECTQCRSALLQGGISGGRAFGRARTKKRIS